MIVTLAGGIGSGKSTLAKALAATLGAPAAGFGDYVRALAAQRDLDTTQRKVLQDLGHELVTSDARSFLDGALAWSGHTPRDTLVLDGLRHMTILQALRRRAAETGDPLLLVFLDTPSEVRRARAATRGVSAAQFDRDDAHPAERDLRQALRAAADLIVPGERPVANLIQAITAAISARGSATADTIPRAAGS